ncbi:MAG: hypothetical protein LBU81_01670 [Methanosarcinales archaeon]|jgi:hypothetical protein|nr:hypothetical protein [Methanosarcinales archaeon]
MGRVFSETDIQIFNKLAPEAGGSTNSGAGHSFPFILRPVSHRFADSGEDFRERLSRLSTEEIDYLAGLVLSNQEEITSLNEEDMESFLELVEERISFNKRQEITRHLGIVG